MKTPAIVLTYDRYRCATENMIIQYERLLGPDFFHFYVPYQESIDLDARISSEVRFIKTNEDIQSTIRSILSIFDEEQMIYWCIDDKYPIELDKSAFEKSKSLLTNNNIDGLSLALARLLQKGRGLRKEKHLALGTPDFVFYKRTNFNQFWLHQFMKVKCLRFVFDKLPKILAAAKEMDFHLDNIIDNPFNMFVSGKNHITFGESTTRGFGTKNFFDCLKANNLLRDLNEMEFCEHEIIIGKLGETINCFEKSN